MDLNPARRRRERAIAQAVAEEFQCAIKSLSHGRSRGAMAEIFFEGAMGRADVEGLPMPRSNRVGRPIVSAGQVVDAVVGPDRGCNRDHGRPCQLFRFQMRAFCQCAAHLARWG
jgi:hypothetical protein